MAEPRFERLRYWLWWRLADRPNICPARSHSRVVWGVKDAGVSIDRMCRDDAAANGACWCGKVREATDG